MGMLYGEDSWRLIKVPYNTVSCFVYRFEGIEGIRLGSQYVYH